MKYNNGNDSSQYFADTLNVIIKTTKIGLWDWHLPSGKVIYSKEWEAIVGYEEGELPQDVKSWTESVLPDDLKEAEKKIDDYLTGKTDTYEAEFRMRRKDGSIIWAQDRGSVTEWDADGTPIRLIGILQDITRLKNTEESLIEKSNQLEYVANLSGLAIWEWDLTTDTIVYHDQYFDLLGYTSEEINGSYEKWKSILHPDDQESTNQAITAYINGETDSYAHETRMRTANGEYIWTLDIARIIKWDQNGTPTHVWGGHLNIDKQKRTELNLQDTIASSDIYQKHLQTEIDKVVKSLKSTQMLNIAMLDASPYITLVFDDNLDMINCNPYAYQYFNFPSKEIFLSESVDYLEKTIPPFQPDGTPSNTLAGILGLTIQRGYYDFEIELLINKKRVPFHAVFQCIKYNNSFIIVGHMIDLSSLKEATNELMRQDILLYAVNNIASILLSSYDETEIDSTLRETLKILGECINVNRAYIWKFTPNIESFDLTQLTAWYNSPEYSDKIVSKIEIDDMASEHEWFGKIMGNENIIAHSDDFDDLITPLLGLKDVVTLLVTPIFMQGEFWGIIGFEDCWNKREFSSAEQNIIKSSGILIASAILRNDMTNSLIAAKEAALESSKAKNEFLSRMSHEIRTPMNAIIGMTTIAQRSDDIENINYCLDRISTASNQLLNIINDILDIAKIEANKFEIVPNEFNFEKMIHDIFNMMQVKMEEKSLDFLYDFDYIFDRNIICDELRLSQVILNLLSNAVKFTPNNGKISLKVKVNDIVDESATLYIEIKDSGIGISDEQKEKLFRSFEQADGSITRKYGGTGLGLAISKRIVNLMGGDIYAESEFGKGSCFMFDVKIKFGNEIEHIRIRKPLSEAINILVVDDSEDVLVYFKKILKSFSVKCDTAINGRTAIDMVANSLAVKKSYDIIFIDWHMPEMNGLMTARMIKEIMDDNVIVIMISVADWSEIEKEALGYNISEFLPKPVLPSVLYNKIVELTSYSPIVKSDDMELPELQTYNWKHKHILVAEDVDINKEILCTILEDTQVNIDLADNGKQVVDMFIENNNKYDLILMDVQMPEMDGLEATKCIRKLNYKNANEIPIIAMTANAFKEDMMDCIAAGMNEHIAKPINIHEFINKLAFYLEI